MRRIKFALDCVNFRLTVPGVSHGRFLAAAIAIVGGLNK